MDPSFTPKFVKRFAEAGEAIRAAVACYANEVRASTFPDDAHSFHTSAVRLVPVAQEEDRDEEPSGGVMGAPV
jgi:3-methyl-2-oxobutanoate hydroxymethyltransferase